MNELDPFWSAYRALQKATAASTNISISLALEGALTTLLERRSSSLGAAEADSNTEIEQSINSFACRERNRARIRLRHHTEIERNVAEEGALTAMVRINEVRALLSVEDWDAVLAVAMGFTYKELASSNMSPAALRVRVSRSREQLRHAA